MRIASLVVSLTIGITLAACGGDTNTDAGSGDGTTMPRDGGPGPGADLAVPPADLTPAALPLDMTAAPPSVGTWKITTTMGVCGLDYVMTAVGSGGQMPGEFNLHIMGNQQFPENYVGCTMTNGTFSFTCTLPIQQGYVTHGGCNVGIRHSTYGGSLLPASGGKPASGTLDLGIILQGSSGCMQYNCNGNIKATFSVAP